MPQPRLPFKEFHWTPVLAYVVGLLVTDGNLSKDGRHINMRSSDKNLLVTFKTCLNLKNKIARSHNDGYATRPSYRIQFSDVQLYNWLVSIGITPAKTYTLGLLKIPAEYFQDFLRGHLDGDGSITAYTDRYNIYQSRTYINQRIFTRFTSASEIHIRWLLKKINTIVGVIGALIYKPPHTVNRVPMWDIKFAKKESIKLLKWIYYKEKLPCLQRKRRLAEKIIKKVAEEKRRKYTSGFDSPRGV